MAKDILSKIVENKKKEIVEAQKRLPEKQLVEQALIIRNRRPFLNKFKTPGPFGVNIIAEIKRASPSKGVIRPGLDPAALAFEYEQGGAAALSVLTDQAYFQGSLQDFTSARKTTTLPVLRKDFLISSYQVYESAVLEADAVLLIARILSREQIRDYLDICNTLKMDALVEVHSEKDLENATWAGAKLIGINNRNLSTFKTDINTAIRLSSYFEPDQIAVALSGILTREDIKKNQQAGIINFLIGESLVRSENPRGFLKSLMGNNE